MPLHLQSVTNDTGNPKLLAWIISRGQDECDSFLVSEDRRYILMKADIRDVLTDEKIGALVYTLNIMEERKAILLLDIDIVLYNKNRSSLRFLKKLEGSSDANEYYQIETADEEKRLNVETVCRHAVPGETLDGEREAYISVFPFELSVFRDITAFNRQVGFAEEKELADTGIKVAGFSETFAMPGGLLDKDKDPDDVYSFMLGTVREFRDVSATFGGTELDFVLAHVDTALGTVPVAMGRDVFDLSELAAGCTVVMNAFVKADLAEPDSFEKAKTGERDGSAPE